VVKDYVGRDARKFTHASKEEGLRF